MSMFKIDPVTRDLVRAHGSLVRVDGRQEIADHFTFRAQIHAGEVPWSPNVGMRWRWLLAKGTPIEELEMAVMDCALETPGIVLVDDVTATVDAAARTARITWSGVVSLRDRDARAPSHGAFSLAPGFFDVGE